MSETDNMESNLKELEATIAQSAEQLENGDLEACNAFVNSVTKRAKLLYATEREGEAVETMAYAAKLLEGLVKKGGKSEFLSHLARTKMNMGIILRGSGDVNGALKSIEASLTLYRKLDKENEGKFGEVLIQGLINKAQILQMLENHESAVKTYGQAIKRVFKTEKDEDRELDEKKAFIYIRKHISLKELGLIEEAIESLDFAAALYAKMVLSGNRDMIQKLGDVLIRRAVTLADNKDYEEAWNSIKKAVKTYAAEKRNELPPNKALYRGILLVMRESGSVEPELLEKLALVLEGITDYYKNLIEEGERIHMGELGRSYLYKAVANEHLKREGQAADCYNQSVMILLNLAGGGHEDLVNDLDIAMAGKSRLDKYEKSI